MVKESGKDPPWLDLGRELIIALKSDIGKVEVGDSGDELGEGSVKEGESNVDIVVVGEESVESEEMEAAL